MNIIEGTCPVCHGRIGIPAETEYARCPLCNATFRIAAAATPQTTVAAPAPVSPMPTVQPGQPTQAPVQAPVGIGQTGVAVAPVQATMQTPLQTSGSFPASVNPNANPGAPAYTYRPAPRNSLLAGWQTSVGMTVLGIAVLLVYAGISELPITTFAGAIVMLIISLALVVFDFIYCLKIYPSYFSDNPPAMKNSTISFLNGFVGSFIFGPIWNSNLTKGTKGISNIVYAAIQGVVFVLSLIVTFANL